MIPSHQIRRFLQFQFQAHPWHGISAQPKTQGAQLHQPHPHLQTEPPAKKDLYHVFIELTPTDGVKYEVDKETGHIKVDRPQKFSNLCPTLYGFVPRTYCGTRVGDFCTQRLGAGHPISGDGDPLDICVLTEKPIAHTGIVVIAKPIGGLRMVDANQADDKIVAVLENDVTYGHLDSIEQLPPGLVDRLRQYFLTYKLPPPHLEKVGDLAQQADSHAPRHVVQIPQVYGRDEALQVIAHSLEDYKEHYGSVHEDLAQFLFELAQTVGDHANLVAASE